MSGRTLFLGRQSLIHLKLINKIDVTLIWKYLTYMTIITIDIDKLPIHSDPEILSGATVFVGTRVPVQTLFDYIEDGCLLNVFLENFPSVKKEDALKVLNAARDTFIKANLTE